MLYNSILYLYRQTKDPQYWIKGLRAVGFTDVFIFPLLLPYQYLPS